MQSKLVKFNCLTIRAGVVKLRPASSFLVIKKILKTIKNLYFVVKNYLFSLISINTFLINKRTLTFFHSNIFRQILFRETTKYNELR